MSPARRRWGAAWRRRWEALAGAAALDSRREPWTWDGEGRLLLRSARALRAASVLAADLGEGPAVLPARRREPWRIAASRSALRRAPAHAAEQISQLRLGDPFWVWYWDAGRLWAWGAGEDGYPGWLRAWQLLPGPAASPRRVVAARASRALAAPAARAPLLLDLSFGTRLAPAGAPRAGFQPWRLPDGRRAWTPLADLAPWPGRRSEAAGRRALLERGLLLLGVPYEWGGAASSGLDCSGFVQLLAGSLGLALPRDADLQAAWGRPRALAHPETWRLGDMLFYGAPRVDHVGILAAADAILHASGELRLERLERGGCLRGRAPVAVRDLFGA